MSATYTYIACRDEGTIEAHVLDEATGRLRRIAVVEGVADINTLTMDHRRGILYATQGGMQHPSPTLWVFTVVAGGRIELRGTATMPRSVSYLAFDPTAGEEHPELDGVTARDGLLAASYHHDAVMRLPLDPQGLPKEELPVWIDDSAGRAMHAMVPTADGRHVYATSLGDDHVVTYRRGGPGEEPLVRAGTLKVEEGSGPRHCVVHPDGHRVALLTEMSGSVRTYHRDQNSGALAEYAQVRIDDPEDHLALGVARLPGAGPLPERPMWAAELMHARGGDYILTTERTTSALMVFDAGPNPRRRARTRTEECPRAAAVAPNQELVLVGGELSGHVSVYRVEGHGVLKPIQRIATGARPSAFAFYQQ